MNDFIGDNQCVTHHSACDCREAKFEALQAENKKLRESHWVDLDITRKIVLYHMGELNALTEDLEAKKQALKENEK